MSLAGRIRLLGYFFTGMGFYSGVDGFMENRKFDEYGKVAVLDTLPSKPGVGETNLSFTTDTGRKVLIRKYVDELTAQALTTPQSMKIVYVAHKPRETRWTWQHEMVMQPLILGVVGLMILFVSYRMHPRR